MRFSEAFRRMNAALIVLAACASDGATKPAPGAELASSTEVLGQGAQVGSPAIDPYTTPIDASASCEELQSDYARIRANRSPECSSDGQCRCSRGGVVPVRLCGAVDFASTSRLLDAIHDGFIARGCRENWCNGRPCSDGCRDWKCTPACREGRCVNTTGESER